MSSTDDVVEDGPHTVSGGRPIGPMGKDDPAEDGVGGPEESSGKLMELQHAAELEQDATALPAGPALNASTPEKSFAKPHESAVSNRRKTNVKDFMRAERSAMWQEEEARTKLRHPLTE